MLMREKYGRVGLGHEEEGETEELIGLGALLAQGADRGAQEGGGLSASALGHHAGQVGSVHHVHGGRQCFPAAAAAAASAAAAAAAAAAATASAAAAAAAAADGLSFAQPRYPRRDYGT